LCTIRYEGTNNRSSNDETLNCGQIQPLRQSKNKNCAYSRKKRLRETNRTTKAEHIKRNQQGGGMSKEQKTKTFMGVFGALALGILVLVACNNQDYSELKEIPSLSESNINISKGDIGLYFSQQKTFNWTNTKVPTNIKVTLFDTKYKRVDYYFFLKFNKWFEKLKFENGIMPINQKENLDCDNFAMLYKSLMGISGYKSANKEEPSVAVVVVRQINEYGGIPSSNGLHMVNLVMTNNGWFIFEPQSGKYILLEDYPNQEYIEYLIF